MKGRFCLLLLAPLVAALALFSAGPAQAQGQHLELSSSVPGLGEVVLSFDLPADFTAQKESPGDVLVHWPAGEYGPDLSGVVASWHESAGTPGETAREVLARVDPEFDTITDEGPLSVGEFEGYTARTRTYYYEPDPTAYYPSLLVLVPLGEEEYVWLWANGTPEVSDGRQVLLESGEPVAQANQRLFDTIIGSLTVSAPPPEEPTPEPITPTPTAVEPTPVAPEGERVEVGPIEEEGKEYTFSFKLPEGYSVGEGTRAELTAYGSPVGGTPRRDELRVNTIESSGEGTVTEAARQWAEAGCRTTRDHEERPQIVMEGSVSLGETDGYFVHWACMWDTTTGPVPAFPHLLVLIAPEGGRFIGLEADQVPSPFVCSYYTPGECTVDEVMEVDGRPLDEVHRANLDAILASLRVSIEDLGAPQTEFVGSVPGPDEISTDPEVIGTNIFLALFVIFAFLFTSTLFNQTLHENRREIEGWVGRFFTPFRRVTSLVERRYGMVAERRPWVQRLAGPAIILVLTGLIYGFLSPDFGFNTKSVVLFVSLVVGVGAITYLYEGGQALFTTRRFRLGAGVKLYAVALAIAAGCVLLSRLVDFQPGFLYGFVASYTLLAPVALDRRQSGQIVFFPAIALLALSVVAWLLVIPLREVTQGSDAWWVALPEGAAVAVFVVGLQGLFFNMIPLSFMDGAKIAEWNRLLWFLMFGAAGFLFWHVLLNQEGAYLDALPEKRVIGALSLLAFYSIVTLATWAYFRGRVYGWAMPSMATVRGTVAGWARGAIERVPRIRWRRGPR